MQHTNGIGKRKRKWMIRHLDKLLSPGSVNGGDTGYLWQETLNYKQPFTAPKK